jgi:2-haloacid dehalogenase
MNPKDLRILAFDVFGTVVDWHSSIAAAVTAAGLPVDAAAFAREWRAGYQPAMQGVRSGERGWVKLDTLHREILDGLLTTHGLFQLPEADRERLTGAWHRLTPWPDAVEGLSRLRRRYLLCTLSNGNLGLLSEMAKHAGLPWDCILSAEVFRRYKPDPAVYHGAAEVFAVPEHQVLMVAAHHSDLTAARACGLRTAYVERPNEFGTDQPKDVAPNPDNDCHATDLMALAEVLGC